MGTFRRAYRRLHGLFVLLGIVVGSVLVMPSGESAELLVGDRNSNSIKRYDGVSGAYIGDFVAPGSGGLHWPEGICWGPDGNLYVSSNFTNSVIRYNGLTGALIGDFIPANTAGMSGQIGLAFGPDGNLYVASWNPGRIMRFNGTTGAFMDTFVASAPNGVAQPAAIAFGPDGNLYVVGFSTREVKRYNGRAGAFIDQFVPDNGTLDRPVGMAFGPDNNAYVSGGFLDQVQKYELGTRAYLGAFVSQQSGGLTDPQGVLFGPDRNLYVATTGAILRYDGQSGAFKDRFATGGNLNFPYMFVFAPLGGSLQAPASLNFGSVPPGSSTSAPVLLRNLSNSESLRMRIDAPAPPFSLVGGGRTVTLPPGGAIQLTVGFQPAALGTFAGAITLDTGDLQHLSARIQLSGVGGAPQPPASPSGLTATLISTARVDLSWAAGDANATSFTVERRQGSSAYATLVTVDSTQTIYSDTTVNGGTSYTYRVWASGAGGNSGYSNEATVDVPAAPLIAPTQLKATAVAWSNVDLTWTAADARATAYEVERKLGSGSYALIGRVNAPTVTYSDTTVTPSAAYTYRVRATSAINGATASGYSNELPVTTPIAPPTAPSVTTAVADSATSIKITWSGGSGQAGYYIERKPDGGDYTQVGTAGSSATSYTDSGLLPNRRYTYRIRAYNSSGTSDFGPEAAATTLPAPLTGLVATVMSSSRVELQWTDPNLPPVGVTVERSDDGTNYRVLTTRPAGTLVFSDSGLLSNTLYRYRVRATGAGGTSDAGEIKPALTYPEPPTGLTTQSITRAQVVLQWTDRSAQPSAFVVERSSDSGATFSVLATTAVGATSYADQPAGGGLTYQYRVRAVNATGSSDPSAAISAAIPMDPPAAPTGLRATVASAAEIELSWSGGSGNAEHFVVERASGSGGFQVLATLSADTVAYADTAAQVGITYHYRVKATNRDADSGYSNTADATIPAGGKLKTSGGLSFGTVRRGIAKTAKLTLTNVGKGNLLVTVGALGAPFRVTAGSGTTVLPPKKNVKVTVEFRPVAAQGYSGTLLVTSTDPVAQQLRVGVSGRGK